MFELHQRLNAQIQVLHENGHVGVEGNELADRMSIMAIETRDTNFTRYNGELSIEALLAKRAG